MKKERKERMKNKFTPRMDSLLAVSFVGETKLLKISGEEIEETESAGFSDSEQTLLCGNSNDDQIIQVLFNQLCIISG